MAIYHFSAQIIARSTGRSSVAAAAYRSASQLDDLHAGRAHDFSAKLGVIHSEILLPDGAPAHLCDRATLWNAVEAHEKRKDAQLAREIEFALPREMSPAEAIALARDFVSRTFVAQGMIADLNVHWDQAPDGGLKPHAHVMLSLRSVGPEGFGPKVRAWNAVAELQGWRERWSGQVNAHLATLGIDARIDHRTLAAQGLPLEPQNKIGPAGARRLVRGEAAERADEHRQIAARNGAQLLAEPALALAAVTQQQSSFTRRDLARFVHRHTDGAAQFAAVMAKVEAVPDVVRLGADARGEERFTTRTMQAVERTMAEAGAALAAGRGHGVSRSVQAAALRGQRLGLEQAAAFRHVTGAADLSLVVGFAGTGKSTLLGAARVAWERAGYTVKGAALSGIAAEGLEAGSGITSRTIASYGHAWDRGREALSSRDVLVVDEAGMVGSLQMERLLSVARAAGAKVVLVGDPEQLQAIAAGAAFRALAERHGAAALTTVRRQTQDWQRAATRELATARTGAALARYEAAGMVRAHASREEAQAALIAEWDAARRAAPGERSLILAATRVEVRALNEGARAMLRAAGELGVERTVETERGTRCFAAGDRVMFLRNERSLGVKNGTLGTLEAVTGGAGSEAASTLVVRLDGAEGRRLAFDVKDYAAIDHGFSATVHKAQGVTVDRVQVLASARMDRHSAYVALTRHRSAVTLHWAQEDLVDRMGLERALSREGAKDTTLDYPIAEERLAAAAPGSAQEPERAAGPRRDLFAGLKLAVPPPLQAGKTPEPDPSSRSTSPPDPGHAALLRAVEDYARAYTDAARMRGLGLAVLEHQRVALASAGAALDEVRAKAVRDLRSALRHDPQAAQLLREMTGSARAAGLVAGLEREAAAVRDPEVRALRLVSRWQGLEAEYAALSSGDPPARSRIEVGLRGVAEAIRRDSAVEAVLRQRGTALGIDSRSALGRALAREGVPLAESLSRGLDQGLSARHQGWDLSR